MHPNTVSIAISPLIPGVGVVQRKGGYAVLLMHFAGIELLRNEVNTDWCPFVA